MGATCQLQRRDVIIWLYCHSLGIMERDGSPGPSLLLKFPGKWRVRWGDSDTGPLWSLSTKNTGPWPTHGLDTLSIRFILFIHLGVGFVRK